MKLIKDLADALMAHMNWLGAPPADPQFYDSLREDMWKIGKAALGAMETYYPPGTVYVTIWVQCRSCRVVCSGTQSNMRLIMDLERDGWGRDPADNWVCPACCDKIK